MGLVSLVHRFAFRIRLRARYGPDEARCDYRCNICGRRNRGIPCVLVRDREASSCEQCGSSLRLRSVIQALLRGLYGRTLVLPEVEPDMSTKGIGMSDWSGYAVRLRKKLDYVNTYYHREPRLDILDLAGRKPKQYDFIISSDVFEHVPPPVSTAFENARRLLKPGGVLVLTVPYKLEGDTEEHFPNLHRYRIEKRRGRKILVNETREGGVEEHHDLKFHGGRGLTLEMRLFSRASLMAQLARAGFVDIRIHDERAPEFGIDWADAWSLPISAKVPAG